MSIPVIASEATLLRLPRKLRRVRVRRSASARRRTQSSFLRRDKQSWIASSLSLLAMTAALTSPREGAGRGSHPLRPRFRPAQPAACGHNSSPGFPFGNLALTQIIVWLGSLKSPASAFLLTCWRGNPDPALDGPPTTQEGSRAGAGRHVDAWLCSRQPFAPGSLGRSMIRKVGTGFSKRSCSGRKR